MITTSLFLLSMTHWLSSPQPLKKRLLGNYDRHPSPMGSDEAIDVVVVSFHAQGHINPLLQFAKHLAHQGLKVTAPLILTNQRTPIITPTNLLIDHVPLLPFHGTEPETIHALTERRQATIRSYLTQLLTANSKIVCVVYDSIMPWVLDIVKQFGVLGAAFFTQSCAVNSIYYNVHKGWLDVSLKRALISLDGFLDLEPSDLPSFVSDRVKYPNVLSFLSDQFARLNEAGWIFTNTFDTLEPEEMKWMGEQFPFKNIGPMVPSIYLDGRLPNDRDYGVSIVESNTDCNTMNWLDSKGYNSVIYVSFGSTAELGKDQMEELACGLKLSNKLFLWVVRESEIHKLPSNFIEETAEKGLVVNWCPQLQVLAHKSVGCFVTHCGWNSTLEALSLGVPLVAMAQWSDQPTNAKYVEDVWKIGKRVRMEEHGICTRKQIEVCVNEVMEGEDSKEISDNLKKWKELAKAAMSKGGSSDRNINDFVKQILKRKLTL